MEAYLKQFFFCCNVDDQMDAHQLSLGSDPKLEEGMGPLKLPPSSLVVSKLPPGAMHSLNSSGNASARSQGSPRPLSARSLSPEEKRNEKERLQDMVKEFAKAVVDGQPCHYLDPSNVGGPRPASYSIDKALAVFSLCPETGTPISFRMSDVKEVVKDRAETPFSKLSGIIRDEGDFDSRFVCMLIIEDGQLRTLGMQLPNQYERERFFTCMKILRWAMDARAEKT
jgi:hypothetical protein